MIDERRTAQASRYVLGTLSAAETREFEAALRLDPKLALLVQELRGTEGGAKLEKVSTAFTPIDPPDPGTSSVPPAAEPTGPQVTARETNPPRTPGWMLWTPWLLAALLAALCVLLTSALIAASRMLRHQTTELSGQLQQKRREIADLQRQYAQLERTSAENANHYQQRIHEQEASLVKGMEAFSQQHAILTNQLTRQLDSTNRALVSAQAQIETLARTKKALEEALETLGSRERDRFKVVRLMALKPPAGQTGGGLGAAFWSPNDQRGVLAVENLPALPPTQGYQLWLSEATAGAPVSGGLLPVSAGSVRVQFTTDARLENPQRIFITVESALGAASPGGPTVLAGN